MDYILTQKELDNLVSKEKYEQLERVKNHLGKLVLYHTAYTCIHKSSQEAFNYCDNCPLSFCKNETADKNIRHELCSEEKHYSK